MNRLFNLPNNILSEIYEYDTTYRDIFKKQCHFDIWQKSFSHFKYGLLSNIFFQNKHILRGKIHTLLEYLFEDESATWFRYSWYDGQTKSVEKPMVSELSIGGNWKGNKFIYNTKQNLWTDDTYDTDDSNNNYFDDDEYGSENHETLYVEIYLRYPCLNNRVKHHTFSCIIYSNQLYCENQQDGYKFPTYVYKYSDDKFTILQYFDPEYI